ncbi:hypothetical protein ACFPTO_08405 [Paraburkholderia denitrificans]|uniref:Uncharacterized protein n=1 Tax=Paraburkholderia denitrificans TaxID=694025 RepID=A0ABW0J6Y3_9BURK
MNSTIEHPSISITGYLPISAAVSYAQCVNVDVPCTLRTATDGGELVVHELPHALQLLAEACDSLAMPVDLELAAIAARVARHAYTDVRLPDWGSFELSLSVANLATDFLGCDVALDVSFRATRARKCCKHAIVNYQLYACPQGLRASTVNRALSTFSAELHYAVLGARDPGGDGVLFFDSAGYILGSRHGVFVAQTLLGTSCVSAFRPVLAKAAATRITALGHRIAQGAIHLSDLAGCTAFGWVDADLAVSHASLCTSGASTAGDKSLANLFGDLASVNTADDIVVRLQLKG